LRTLSTREADVGIESQVGSEWNHLVREIVSAATELHIRIGPGFLESIYHRGLVVELRTAGLHTSSEVEIPIFHRGVQLGIHRLDLVVAGQAILELKAVAKLDGSHFAQLRSYMAASGLPVGLLINFAGSRVECRRVYSPQERAQYQALRGLRVSAPAHRGSITDP
ncbi:MAG TPA: GxxExxY protein, partial [Gemmatimonadales bacterium]|nr:GxxExxY protein [Gemmatimonadales bacterium]